MRRAFRSMIVAPTILLLLVSCTGSGQNPASRPAPPQSQPASRPQPTSAQPGAVGNPTSGASAAAGVEYLDSVPMTALVNAQRGPVQAGGAINVPIITWGGDVATIYGNGGATTQPGSAFAREGLSLKLFREDNFVHAVERVVTGETPYLRGTIDMVNSALPALADRGIDMVVIYQMTWSTGGDTIVMRSEAGNAPADLAGKEIGVQLFGPHMLYVATVLRDAGLSLDDVKIRWLRELTIPPYDTKGLAVDPSSAMQQDPNLAAVAVISPDMMALTSGGTVGSGAESSVKGARLLLSTKTAGRVIADVYAVRKDYFDAQRDQVRAFVHGLFRSQEELSALVGARQPRPGDYQEMLKTSAELLRDSAQATADIEGLLGDCTFVGLQENQQFFTGTGTLRGFDVLTREAQDALVGYGLLSRPIPLAQAEWNYGQLAVGLAQAGTARAEPRFNPAQVEQIARERELRGTTRQGVLFEFEILFAPNQTDFAADLYRNEFGRVMNLAATYPGAVIVIEGHSDPLKFLQDRQQGVAPAILDQTKQAAKNLSVQRAIAVRESLVSLGRVSQLTLDNSQFTVVGAGIDRPKYANPSTEQEWRANMRVDFQITQVEAELEQFSR